MLRPGIVNPGQSLNVTMLKHWRIQYAIDRVIILLIPAVRPGL